MRIRDEIINVIRRNRISTTEVADCMNKTGLVPGVRAIASGKHVVGPVFWAYAYNESNWALHEQLRRFPEEHVLLVDPVECNDRAVFGSLVSKFIMLYRQGLAIVVKGPLRDMPHLIKENWPIWCDGATPIGCFNREQDSFLPEERVKEFGSALQDAVAVCDDSGVVIIPKEKQDEDFVGKLHFIEEQEDIWFDCIDRLKWDTYDTVCLKKYLEQNR